jgi:hypothetical protein
MPKTKTPVAKAKQRPAETAPIVTTIIAALGSVGVSLSTGQLKGLLIAVAVMPAVVTYIVNLVRRAGARP